MCRQKHPITGLVLLTLVAGMAADKPKLATDPQTPYDQQLFTFAIIGNGFDPKTVNVIFVGPGCPKGPCSVPNEQLETKTANGLRGRTKLPVGTYTVQIMNGHSPLPDPPQLVVAPHLNRIWTHPDPPMPGVPFDVGISGSGFDPDRVNAVVFGGKCQPSGCPLVLLSRGPTSLSAQWTSPVAGSLSIAVRNGSNALSNAPQFSVIASATRVWTHPDPPVAGVPFDFAISGNGFDPMVSVVALGTGCPLSGCPLDLKSRSATLLSGQTTLPAAGEFKIAVRNPSGVQPNGGQLLLAAPKITYFSWSPNPPTRNVPFDFVISGSGFNPVAVKFLYADRVRCPRGCPPNAVTFTTKDSTTLVGRMAIPIPGQFDIVVWNGPGVISNTAPLSVR